ncbi:hypothetical protein FRC18_008804 [Serendipita sp. 400]|nr:hypothetical protein FRC18_008804 [Serendipita sp. 400]
MAETEGAQTWVSTGRGGAGNFPYTPRALSKRPVTLNAPQGREVDYRRQSIARSGRNGVGFWEPTPNDLTKQQEAEEFERDQEVIKQQAMANKRDSLAADGSHVFRSGRGGYGSYAPPTVAEERLPTHQDTTQQPSQPNIRMGDAIPLVDMNRVETRASIATKASSAPPAPSASTESGLATFISYTSAFLNALTPAENRIENMKSSTAGSAKRSSISGAGGGGRGGANKYSYATYTPASASSASSISKPPQAYTGAPKLNTATTRSDVQSQAERGYSAYSSKFDGNQDRQEFDSDMLASSSSSGAGSSHWASPSSSRSGNTPTSPWAA